MQDYKESTKGSGAYAAYVGSRIERARRSMRVTTSVSPAWMKSRIVPSSGLGTSLEGRASRGLKGRSLACISVAIWLVRCSGLG